MERNRVLRSSKSAECNGSKSVAIAYGVARKSANLRTEKSGREHQEPLATDADARAAYASSASLVASSTSMSTCVKRGDEVVVVV